LAGALLLGLPGAVCSAAADELPLTRVVLSSAGLAQFTHSGSVSAGATVELAVRLDQVDDILKSMTVFDREGAVGAVSLAQLDAERKRIAEDQERIRRNLQSVGASSDLGRRYLSTLQSQEDRLAEIERNDAALADQLASTRKSAAELARQLVL
jgi:hypothetical protein